MESSDETVGAPIVSPPGQDVAPPPPGFDFSTPPAKTAGPPQPQGPNVPPPPDGFNYSSAPADLPPPPPGFNLEQNPQDPVPDKKPEPYQGHIPGLWEAFGSSAMKSGIEEGMNDYNFAKMVANWDLGGKPILQSLEENYNNAVSQPQVKDKIDELQNMSWSQAIHDPMWLGLVMAKAGATAGGTIGGGLPGVLAAGVGEMAGIPAPITWAAEAAGGRIIPAYNAARVKGLDPDAAMKQAMIQSGIAGVFAGAMGISSSRAIFGRVVDPAATDMIATQMARPGLEALVQMGAVQPGLAAGQYVTSAVAAGDPVETSKVVESAVGGSVLGGGMHIAHETIRDASQRQQIAYWKQQQPAAPASPETIQAAFEAQQPPKAAESARYEEPLVPREPGPMWYSQVARTVQEKVPNNATADQVMGILRNTPGVKPEEINQLKLESYLRDINGKVNKDDLLAHIEANGLQVRERHFMPYPGEMERDQFFDAMSDKYGAKSSQVSEWDASDQRQLRVLNQKLQDWRATGVNRLLYPQRQYWLPTKDEPVNPREIVFYMGDPVEDRAQQIFESLGDKRKWMQLKAGEKGNYLALAKKEWRDRGYQPPEVYEDPHWTGQAPNTVAHNRVQDLEGPNGERYLGWIESQATGHQAAQRPEAEYLPQPMRTPEAILNDIRRMEAPYREMRDKYEDYSTDDYVRHPMPPEDIATRDRMENLQREWDTMNQWGNAPEHVARVPETLPFKKNWQELSVKRMMRYATDGGYDGIVLPNGDQVGLRAGNERELAGMRVNYDKKIPAEMRKWARKLGGDVTLIKLDQVGGPMDALEHYAIPEVRKNMYSAFGFLKPNGFNRDMVLMKMDPNFSSLVRKGLPLHEEDVVAAHPRKGTRTLSDLVPENKLPGKLAPAARKIDQIIRSLANRFRISRGITINAIPREERWRGRMRDDYDPATGNYVIDVNPRRILTTHDLYASMSHEFGHVIFNDMLKNEVPEVAAPVWAAIDRIRNSMSVGDLKVGDARRLRDNAISEASGARALHNNLRLSDLVPSSKEYLLHQEEIFSEQVAKWMQTDAEPLTVADKFFKSVAKKIRKMVLEFGKAEKGNEVLARPEKEIADWLNSRLDQPFPTMSEPIKEQFDMDTQKANKAAMDREGAPETPAEPMQEASIGGRGIFKSLGLDKQGEGMAAHGDRMNRFYKYALSIFQLRELNRHIRGLVNYCDGVLRMNFEKNAEMAAARQRIQQWDAIRDPRQQFSLSKFIEDYANANFKLPHTEDGLYRRPNKEEFDALVKKHGLGESAVKLFKGITQDFDGFLEKYRKLLIQEAQRIKDPIRMKTSMENINNRIDKLLKRPFMPLTRYGKYQVTVYDPEGNIRHYEQTNSVRRQRQIKTALEKSTDRMPDDKVVAGMVAKDVTPFLGLPPGMIDSIADKLSLSETQKAALDQLRFDYAPAQSFKHQFRNLDLVPGYSTDFRRNYANFFFHGANHITRVKWIDELRDQIKDVRSNRERMARAGDKNGTNKLDQIANFMSDHLQRILDPKPDWGMLRGILFHYDIGFNAATAANNLTQVAIAGYPHLASQFGDIRAIAALTKASARLSNYYKKTKLLERAESSDPGPQGARMRALGEAVKGGVLTENQAHALAAISEDRNLLRNFGTKAENFWFKFQEASGWMFDLSEQFNRRVMFDASWDLGMRDPNGKYAKQAINDSPLQYSELIKKGWTHQEAAAFVVAKDAVIKTQFDYSPAARPRFMTGIGAPVMVFKLFTQNMLFNMLSHPGVLARSLMVMGAMGGLSGLPGWENVNSIIKAIAARYFGKDFDLNDEVRHFAVDLLGGAIGPDKLLHGLSVTGFGIPHLMNSIGALAGFKEFFPTVDMSRSVGMGDILGFDPAKLGLDPTQRDPQAAAFGQLGRATGAGFSEAFNLFNFATSNQSLTDLKRWEPLMPHWLNNISHAYRYFEHGAETNKAGNAIVRFNPNDTYQMMEIIARMGGFQPRRLTEAWERIGAAADSANFWKYRHDGLLRQYAEAYRGGNREEQHSVLKGIRNFNKDLPTEAKGYAVTAKALKESMTNRLRVKARQEAGLPIQRRDIPIKKSLDPYYPQGWPQGQTGAQGVK